jgi:SnoaL-like polyketide cyclase
VQEDKENHMAADGKRIIGRFWQEVYNQGELDLIDEIFAPDYELHDLATRQACDRDGLKDLLGAIRTQVAGAQDARATIEDQMEAEGDRVVTRFTIQVPLGDVNDAGRGSAPADERLSELSGISISRVSEDRIEESWVSWEALRTEQELCPVPPPEEEGTEGPVMGWRWPPWR